MHVDVSLQLAQLAVSVLTGFALGVLYDVLRAMRRVFKINAALDALYCAVLLLALFTLGMDIGQGGVHVFMFCAAAAGCAVYMSLLSGALLPLFEKITAFAAKAASPICKLINKFANCAKKCFSKALNWYTIKKQSRKRRTGAQDEKSTTIVGLALTMLAVYAILNLVSLKRDLADAMEQTSALQAEIQQAQAEGAELEEKMQALDTDEGIESLAKYRLRLIGSDEKIFRDIRG